jgi:hypothetical protein
MFPITVIVHGVKCLSVCQVESGNSPDDCQQVVDTRCSTTETRLANTRVCVSPGAYDCSTECAFSGYGYLDVSLGR